MEKQTRNELEIPVEESFYRLDRDPRWLSLEKQKRQLEWFGLENPYFRVEEKVEGCYAWIQGKKCLNYSNYNYLCLSGHPRVSQMAEEAIRKYGTSAGASRLVAGERPIHRELEEAISQFLGTEDTLVFIGGFVANFSTIGHFVEPGDVIFYDELSHSSIIQGALLSRARRFMFRHNDLESLERLLQEHRHRYKRALIITEGLFSMDGDIPPLPGIVELKKKYKAYLMVDEAHSLGTLGRTGRGVGEHFSIAREDVDIWMGTLSKTFASCGGFISGKKELIEILKYTSPGFVYSVGMSPPLAAAALEALKILQKEPERVQRLQRISRFFLEEAKRRGFDTGRGQGYAVIPIMVGDTLTALSLSQRLLEQGINVLPIFYPAVEADAARLRFFLTTEHTEEEIRYTLDVLEESWKDLGSTPWCTKKP